KNGWIPGAGPPRSWQYAARNAGMAAGSAGLPKLEISPSTTGEPSESCRAWIAVNVSTAPGSRVSSCSRVSPRSKRTTRMAAEPFCLALRPGAQQHGGQHHPDDLGVEIRLDLVRGVGGRVVEGLAVGAVEDTDADVAEMLER